MGVEELPIVSIVIPTHDRKDKLTRLIKSILTSTYQMDKLEVIIVDDASRREVREVVNKEFPNLDARVFRLETERLVAASRNIGLQNSRGEFVLFIDDDAVIQSDTISHLVHFLRLHPNVGIVGPIINDINRPSVTWCGGIRINFWTMWGTFIGKNTSCTKYGDPIESDAIPTVFMTRRWLADKVRFDEILFPIQGEELDFCIRIKQMGYMVVVIPWAVALHETGTMKHLKSPKRTYFEVRNNIISSVLWTTGPPQSIVSRCFTIAHALSYVLISLRYSREYGKLLVR